MTNITDDDILSLYDKAEEAQREGCEAASMPVQQFYAIYQGNVFTNQMAHNYSMRLRMIEVDGTTIYLTYKPNRNNPIVIWKIVPWNQELYNKKGVGYEGKLGRSGWDFKNYLQFMADGSKKIVNYRGIPVRKLEEKVSAKSPDSGASGNLVSQTPVQSNPS